MGHVISRKTNIKCSAFVKKKQISIKQSINK